MGPSKRELGTKFQIEKLRQRFEKAKLAGKPLKEEWLEVEFKEGEPCIVQRGFTFDRLYRRATDLDVEENSDSKTVPKYFICSLNNPSGEPFLLLLKRIGSNSAVQSLVQENRERQSVAEIFNSANVDFTLQFQTAADLNKSKLFPGRNIAARYSVSSTFQIEVPKIPQKFLRDNPEIARARWHITSNSAESTWMILAYHGDSPTRIPYTLPVLFCKGNSGISAFMKSSGTKYLANLMPRKGWLYWIYARVDSPMNSAMSKMFASRRSVKRMNIETSLSKFVLFSYIAEVECAHSAAMFARFATHSAALRRMFRHHVYIEARTEESLDISNVYEALLRATGSKNKSLNLIVKSRDDPALFLPFMCQLSADDTVESLQQVIGERVQCKFQLFQTKALENEEVLKLLAENNGNDSVLSLDQLENFLSISDSQMTLGALGLSSGDEIFVKNVASTSMQKSQTGSLEILDRFQEVRSRTFEAIGANDWRPQHFETPMSKEERSAAAKKQLFEVCKDLGAYLVESADILVTNEKPIGVGKTAQVYEGLLLCRTEHIALYDGLLTESPKAFYEELNNTQDCDEDDLEDIEYEIVSDMEEESKGAKTFLTGSHTSFVAVKVAIKKFTCKFVTAQVAGTFENEIRLLCKLNHPSLVKLLGVYINSVDETWKPAKVNFINRTYESLNAGRLRKSKNWNEGIRFDTRLKMALSVAKGVEYLHSQGVMHRDIKSDNLLIDDNFNLKLGDFGVSTFLQQSALPNAPAGTLGYVAPEVLDDTSNYDLSCDVFSFGVVLWELLNSKANPLFKGSIESYIESMQDNEHIQKLEFPAGTPLEYVDLVKQCLRYKKEDRPTIGECVEVLELLS